MLDPGAKRGIILPIMYLLFVATVSFLGYFGSRFIDSHAVHQFMAKVFGKRSLFNGILAILSGKHSFLRRGESQKV